MLSRISFSIGGRPCAWQRAGSRQAMGGRAAVPHFTPKKVRDAQKAFKAAGKSAMGNKPMMSSALRLTLVCIYAIPEGWPRTLKEAAMRGEVYRTSVPDADNLQKMVMDALNKTVWWDDSQVAEIVFRKRYGPTECTNVIVQEIGHAGSDSIPAPATPADIERRKKASPDPVAYQRKLI